MTRRRGLSPKFMDALLNGFLSPVVNRVKSDHSLDLQIRDEEVHIYYRGGKILGLSPVSDALEGFTCSFDLNYFGHTQVPPTVAQLPRVAHSVREIEAWRACFPQLKESMDLYYGGTVEKNEREFQQVVVRENNYASVSNGTDYFIVDSEYVHPELPVGRADLIAFKWKSQGHVRRKGQVGLSLIEVKYGDKALQNNSGIAEHCRNMGSLARNTEALKVTKEEMLLLFKQKRELGLVRFGTNGNPNEVNSFSDEDPEIMLLLINHDPVSTTLLAELNQIDENDRAFLKVATSNFLGYGLYEECVLGFDDFLSKYKRQLNSRA